MSIKSNPVLNPMYIQVLSGHKSCVRDVSWHPFSAELFSSSWDFSVTRWSGVNAPGVEEEGDGVKMELEKGKRRKVDKQNF